MTTPPIPTVMNKMVNGQLVPMTAAEMSAVQAEWAIGAKQEAANAAAQAAQAVLVAKYVDPFQALDKICTHLGINYSTLP